MPGHGLDQQALESTSMVVTGHADDAVRREIDRHGRVRQRHPLVLGALAYHGQPGGDGAATDSPVQVPVLGRVSVPQSPVEGLDGAECIAETWECADSDRVLGQQRAGDPFPVTLQGLVVVIDVSSARSSSVALVRQVLGEHQHGTEEGEGEEHHRLHPPREADTDHEREQDHDPRHRASIRTSRAGRGG